jgi:uncharacterized protein YneR
LKFNSDGTRALKFSKTLKKEKPKENKKKIMDDYEDLLRRIKHSEFIYYSDFVDAIERHINIFFSISPHLKYQNFFPFYT